MAPSEDALVVPSSEFLPVLVLGTARGALPSPNPARVYLAEKKSRAVLESYLNRLARHVGELAGLAGDELAGITLDAIAWGRLTYVHTTALGTALRSAGLRPASVNTALSALRGVLHHAFLLDQMPADVYAKARCVPGIKHKPLLRGRELTEGELERLFAGCADGTVPGLRDAALLALLYGAGLRRSEASQLLLEDYEIGAAVKVRRHGVAGPKHGHERRVPLARGVAEVLAEWLRLRGGVPGPLLAQVRRRRLGTADGVVRPLAPIDPHVVRDICRRRARRAGIEDFNPHDLRRSVITRMILAEADLLAVADYAGHENLQTTRRYDLRRERGKERAADLVAVPGTWRHMHGRPGNGVAE